MFDNILGNNGNKNKLKSIVENNTISHSYIFSGISGIGKFLFAKEFAKSILCLNKELKPCNSCKACDSFNNLNNPDIIIIDEGNNSIKTEQIKSLTKNVLEKPIQSDKKIYIINNSENMTKEAQNSLLKTLEEPPEYVVIILITSNDSLLLNTIKSRCTKIMFNELSDEEIMQYLSKSSNSINNNIIKAFGGSIERALNIIDRLDLYEEINRIFNSIDDMNELQILKTKETIFKEKDEIYFILDFINTIFRERILKNSIKAEKYYRCIEIIEETKKKLKKNGNFDMTIDGCLFALERSLSSNG